MKKFRYISLLVFLFVPCLAHAVQVKERVDTVSISDLYTTHMVFSTDLIYADLSNRQDVVAMIVEESKDVLAIRATGPFFRPCNLTAMESNGTIHSYILQFRAHPGVLVYDFKRSQVTAPPDSIDISNLFSTHMVFSTEVIYADVSNIEDVAATVVAASKNVFALKAYPTLRGSTSSATVLESSGDIHSYIIRFAEHPASQVINCQRAETAPDGAAIKGEDARGEVVSKLRAKDAPVLSDVIRYPQHLFHVAAHTGGVTAVCENVFAYSDITYIVLRITNNSGVSYEADRTTFVVGARKRSKKIITEETNILPKSSLGTLTVAPGETARIVYSFDKITLSKEQAFRIGVYEMGGRREFLLTLAPEDINLAMRPHEGMLPPPTVGAEIKNSIGL